MDGWVRDEGEGYEEDDAEEVDGGVVVGKGFEREKEDEEDGGEHAEAEEGVPVGEVPDHLVMR